MNDNDLDELLDGWMAPAPPPLIRNRLRAEFRARNSWPRRLRGLGITLLAAAALFALIGNAISQTPSPIPTQWTAESEFIRYAPNGASVFEMTAISYSLNGNEIVWSRSAPRAISCQPHSSARPMPPSPRWVAPCFVFHLDKPYRGLTRAVSSGM